MPADLGAFLERHRDAAPADVDRIASALAAGRCAIRPWQLGPPAAELRAMFSRQAEQLARHDGAHARRLRREVEGLCASLARAGDAPCAAWGFDFDDGQSITFWVHGATGELFAVMHTVDRRKVSDEAWRALWRNADEAG